MITLRKLRTLKESTRFRKYIIILQELEVKIENNNLSETTYYNSIFNEIKTEENIPSRTKDLLNEKLTIRVVNSLRHTIMAHLGIEPSEWDFTAPLDKRETDSINKLGINLYLDDIRSPFNLGSIFRTGECFGMSKMYLSKDCTSPEHKRAIRTSMGSIDLVEWKVESLKNIKLPMFALELGGTPIDDFEFPSEGVAIIGSEELGVSPEALKLADQSLGRVTIPLHGSKSSLNVANATSILLQRWSEKILKV